MHAFTPLILRKSRMRRRARTDLRGGRSAMIVPTATVIPADPIRIITSGLPTIPAEPSFFGSKTPVAFSLNERN
jgi:hypothetical protein